MRYDRLRRYLQLFFLLIAVLLFLHLIIRTSPVAHSYCPMAAVCFGCLNLGQDIGSWMFPAALLLGLAIIIFTLFLGRRFCGNVCPFGTIQELLFGLNKKAKKRKYKTLIPRKTHTTLKYLKYLILLWVILSALFAVNYIYMSACPVLAVAHPQNLLLPGLLSLLVIFIGGFFIERFWCLYLCPFAALLNAAQFLGKILHLPRQKIFWNKDCCTNCQLCDDFCPMRIEVQSSEKVTNVECIYCHRCQLCCPVLRKRKSQ